MNQKSTYSLRYFSVRLLTGNQWGLLERHGNKESYRKKWFLHRFEDNFEGHKSRCSVLTG